MTALKSNSPNETFTEGWSDKFHRHLSRRAAFLLNEDSPRGRALRRRFSRETPRLKKETGMGVERGKLKARRTHGKPIEEQTGPGSLFAVVIKTVTGKAPSSNCQCGQRASEMNLLGWRGCLDRLDIIVGWLAEEAGRMGIKVEPNMKAVVAQGIKMLQERGETLDLEVFQPLADAVDADPGLGDLIGKKWAELGFDSFFNPPSH